MTASKMIIIDNYDSFVYNLYHLIHRVLEGVEIEVYRNDKLSISDLEYINPDAIFISPGPCSPKEAGICTNIVKLLSGKYPIFGVCLGYQVICEAFGGTVVASGTPVHGKISNIKHNKHKLYNDIPDNFGATRYHSLHMPKDTVPKCLEVTAHSDDGCIMSVSHSSHQTHGVQYHPESIGSEYGNIIIKNFLTSAGLLK